MAHHDDRQAEQGEYQQLEGAGELGDRAGIEQQKGEDRAHRYHDGDRGRPALALDTEEAGQQVIATHRQRIPRSAEDSCVRHRREGQERRHRNQHSAPGAGKPLRGLFDRRQGIGEALGARDADHHPDAQGIHDDRRAQAQEDPQRQVPLGVLHLFGDAGDVGHPHVADEHQPAGAEDGAPGRSVLILSFEEAAKVVPIHRRRPLPDEPGQDPQEPDDHHDLKAAGPFGTQQVDDPKEDRQPRGDQPEGHYPGLRDDQRHVRAHPDQGEGRFEHQGQPRAQAADGPRQRAQAAIKEVVRAARPRHRRSQLHDAQHRRNQEGRRDDVAEHHRRAGFGRGQARKQEETGAQRGAGRDRIDAEEGQLLLEAPGLVKVGHAKGLKGRSG